MPPGKAAYKDRALWDVPVGMLSGVHPIFGVETPSFRAGRKPRLVLG